MPIKRISTIEKIMTVVRTDAENKAYKENLENAISHIEEAISQISYRSNLIDEDTQKVINAEIINKLQDMIYELEEVGDKPVFKPEVK